MQVNCRLEKSSTDCASAVILVGTHLDEVESGQAEELLRAVMNKYNKVFAGMLREAVAVSCTTMRNRRELRHHLYKSAM